ncbi:MAG: YggS family pyridoxal phosphate-dependent enzyme [Spirochaetia bacterium]
MNDIDKNINNIRTRIDDAAKKAGRSGKDVQLMAVSKTKTREQLEAAYRAGLRLFGENRVQEAYDKYENFYPDARLHIIGHLQSNKAKQAVEIACCVQSIDKLKTARELEKRCAAIDKQMDVFMEFNTSGEDSKSGYLSKDSMYSDMEQIALFPHLHIRGLMTIGPFTDNSDAIRRAFAQLKSYYEESKERFPELPIEQLSMGMTSDFEIAVEEGSTMVRIGTALFGSR